MQNNLDKLLIKDIDNMLQWYIVELCNNFCITQNDLICASLYQEIVQSCTIQLNNYLHYFEINTKSPDELKLAYFAGITLSKYVNKSYKKQVLFEMLSLMKDISSQILNETESKGLSDLFLNRNLTKMEHLIYSDDLWKNMGDFGLYMMFRSIINQSMGTEENQVEVLENRKRKTEEEMKNKSESDNYFTTSNFTPVDFENTVGG